MGELAYLPRLSPYVSECSAMSDLNFVSQQLRQALHELAQPLAIIVGTIDLLLYEAGDGWRQNRELEQVSRCLQQIIDLVNDLRRLAVQLQTPRPDN